MLVELKFPTEFQGTVTGDINKSAFLAFIAFESLYQESETPANQLYLW